MSTSYQNIYGRFLSKITDFDHDNILGADLDALMLGYLKSAIPKFTECKTNLARNDTTTAFTNTLSELEEEFISLMMVVEWMRPRINYSDLMEQQLSSKDFEQFSQANQIKELRALKKDTQTEIDDLIVKYTYSGDLSELS